MKKKKIEQVPYIGLDKLVRKKEVLFVGVTAVKKVGNEMNLFLEVYKNTKEGKQIPVIRYVASKTDWTVYDTRYSSFSHRKLNSYDWGEGFVWYEDRQEEGRGYQEKRKANVLSSEKDLERTKKFFKNRLVGYLSKDSSWYNYFNAFEDYCDFKKRQRGNELRKERLKARSEQIAEADKKELFAYADKNFFENRHYIYYTKKSTRADLICTACGEITSGKWKPGQSYESQFEHLIPEPRSGKKIACPFCKEQGIMKPLGKQKGETRITAHMYVMAKYGDMGACIRYFEIDKAFYLQTIDKVPVSAGELKAVTEISRTYVKDGKTQTDYHKYNPYLGYDFWDDCNLAGMANIIIGKAPVYPPSWEKLKGTCMEYCAAKEYADHAGDIDMRDYAEKYIEYPQLEMLVKMQMFDIVKHGMYLLDKHATTPEYLLGIRRDRIRYLSEKKGDMAIFQTLRLEKSLDMHWSPDQIEKLSEMKLLNHDTLAAVLQMMSLEKFLNRVSEYSGCDYGTGCQHSINRLMSTAAEYMDYLSMRRQLGYDMSNTVYLHPRDLSAAHQKMVAEMDKKGFDRRILEVMTKYPDIKKNYRKLRSRYYFENDSYMIRPARNAGEIVREGRQLHHCVGGDNYLKSHNDGRSYILFLRFKDKKEMPYITIEINPKGENIMQWYGAHDKKPDEANMKRLIEEYTKSLKETITA